MGTPERCLWSEDVVAPPREKAPLPESADVVVVGGGYTGLAAARALARRGKATVVLERQAVGWGASGRNGGFVLPGFQPGLGELVRRDGADRARALFRLSLEAVRHLEALMSSEGIACDHARTGAIALAERESELRRLERERRVLQDVAGYETVVLDRAALAGEVGSNRYAGGLLDPGAAALHPARLCAGLAGAAERAGARVVEGAEVLEVARAGGALAVRTARGSVRAGQVLVATNGYTGPAFGRLRRRVVPVGSHIVATAPLDPGLARRLIPGNRVLSTTRHLLHYFRLTPDGRMLFGGRASFTPIGTGRSAGLLAAAMRQVFPELARVPVEYAWSGQVAFTRDRLPHAGRLGELHHALGYAGHGVALATWLGDRMGEAIAAGCAPPELGRLPGIPLYGGRPWFLPLAGAYYRLRDWVG